MSTSLLCLTFKEPLFQVRLKQENLEVLVIGVIFSIDTVTYTITSFLLNFVPEKSKDFSKLVAMGMVAYVAGMVLTGPAPYILPDELWIICLGTLLSGSAGALVNNNCVPALSQALEKDYDHLDMQSVKNNISAINTGAFGLGSILGPILASNLDYVLDFRWSFTIIAFVVLFVALL